MGKISTFSVEILDPVLGRHGVDSKRLILCLHYNLHLSNLIFSKETPLILSFMNTFWTLITYNVLCLMSYESRVMNITEIPE